MGNEVGCAATLGLVQNVVAFFFCGIAHVRRAPAKFTAERDLAQHPLPRQKRARVEGAPHSSLYFIHFKVRPHP
jgi:hypothetical protein